MKIEAAKPAISPTVPPPRAIMRVSLPRDAFSIVSIIETTVSMFFEISPAGSIIKAGTVCDELVCQSDLMATCADMINDTIPDSAGEDSITMMPLFKEQKNSYRDSIIHHSLKGKFAIRDKQWKLLLCPGSGGWAMEDSVAYNKGLPMVQLYDMQQDVGEMNNLCKKHPEIVRSMIKDLEQIIDNGRSTLGVKQLNDVPIDIWKLDSIPGIDRTIIDDY